MSATPFHRGEHEAQARAGVFGMEAWAGRVIRPYLPEQHRIFFAALPVVVLAARDHAGRPWATLLAGAPGFASSPTPTTLRLDARPGPHDPLAGALTQGADVGILGLMPEARRRNRANGAVLSSEDGALWIGVRQSFGNCPQYIHRRAWRAAPPQPRPASRTAALHPAQAQRIQGADTFFLASGYRGEGEHPGFGLDASHRGGPPGVVTVEGATRLVFPDYSGNNYFNTVGNLLLDARLGMLFVDFQDGGLLAVTGRAALDWAPDPVRFPGASRLIRLDIEEVVEQAGLLPLRWDDLPNEP